jgi:TonB-dependent receptor
MVSRSSTARLRALSSVSALALCATPALAQDPAAGIEEIVIRGVNLSRQIAVENKRNSDAIIDSISADDLGRLPDKNTAEALSRVPGVNITIDQGEGRYVSIRGASPALNSVTINGLAVGSVEENSRRVPLDILGGELLGGIDVVKAVTPDLEANAIGGYINVKTQSPHDNDQNFFGRASARIGDDEYGGRHCGRKTGKRRGLRRTAGRQLHGPSLLDQGSLCRRLA